MSKFLIEKRASLDHTRADGLTLRLQNPWATFVGGHVMGDVFVGMVPMLRKNVHMLSSF